MSLNEKDIFVQAFSRRMKLAYQMGSRLRHTVELETDVEGESYRWHVLNKGMANLKQPQQDVVPMNLTFRKPLATMEDWHAAEYIDKFNIPKMNVRVVERYARSGGYAIGRRIDQVILNAVSSATIPTSRTVGVTDSAIKAEVLGDVRAAMIDQGIGYNEDIFAILPAPWYKALAKDDKVSSMDFNVGRTQHTGRIPMLHGISIIFVEDRATREGWNSAGKIGYAWPRSAMGLAEGISTRTEIGYVRHKTSTLINCIWSGCSGVIDTDGLVKLQGD